jgi:hypothetical protein
LVVKSVSFSEATVVDFSQVQESVMNMLASRLPKLLGCRQWFGWKDLTSRANAASAGVGSRLRVLLGGPIAGALAGAAGKARAARALNTLVLSCGLLTRALAGRLLATRALGLLG